MMDAAVHIVVSVQKTKTIVSLSDDGKRLLQLPWWLQTKCVCEII